jgi:hypothetical protein
MSEMVSAALESEKKPLSLSQVSPKAQQGWAHNYSRFNFNGLLIFSVLFTKCVNLPLFFK